MTAASASLKVFITGASSGLGAALAAHYGARGAVLGLVARRAEKLAEVAVALATPSTVYALDVADRHALAAAAADFCSRHGTPDIVIANAGISAGTDCGNPEDVAALEAAAETWRDATDGAGRLAANRRFHGLLHELAGSRCANGAAAPWLASQA